MKRVLNVLNIRNILFIDSGYITTPAPPLYFPTSATAPPATSLPTLADFHLQDYSWLESVLDASASSIVLPTNDTTVTLKLSKETEVNITSLIINTY